MLRGGCLLAGAVPAGAMQRAREAGDAPQTLGGRHHWLEMPHGLGVQARGVPRAVTAGGFSVAGAGSE